MTRTTTHGCRHAHRSHGSGTARPDLGERWPSQLVATAAEDHLSSRGNSHTSFAAVSDCRAIAIYEYTPFCPWRLLPWLIRTAPEIPRCRATTLNADRDGSWSRRLPPIGSGAPLIPLVGASGSIAGRQFILDQARAGNCAVGPDRQCQRAAIALRGPPGCDTTRSGALPQGLRIPRGGGVRV